MYVSPAPAEPAQGELSLDESPNGRGFDEGILTIYCNRDILAFSLGRRCHQRRLLFAHTSWFVNLWPIRSPPPAYIPRRVKNLYVTYVLWGPKRYHYCILPGSPATDAERIR
jgi:hypothetical protein